MTFILLKNLLKSFRTAYDFVSKFRRLAIFCCQSDDHGVEDNHGIYQTEEKSCISTLKEENLVEELTKRITFCLSCINTHE